MHGCLVCENPRRLDLTTSQIEWHNMGHPGHDALRTSTYSRKLRGVVIIRPGDQILYEAKPGSWSRIDEINLAIAAGHSVDEIATNCRRCFRLVLERRISPHGFWRSLLETIASRIRRADQVG